MTQSEVDALFARNAPLLDSLRDDAEALIKTLILDLKANDSFIRLISVDDDKLGVTYELVEGDPAHIGLLAEGSGLLTSSTSIRAQG